MGRFVGVTAIRLPSGRAAVHLGVVHVHGGAVTMTPATHGLLTVRGERFAGGPLRSDRDGAPTVIEHQRLLFYVIARGERLALRINSARGDSN